MQKLINFLKKNIFILLVLVLIIPTFFRMLGPGMYSTQDFHLFRLFEFDKCVEFLQIPCRWSPDAGLGYGEPLFNFYGQFSYAVGEVFHLLGASFIDSIKLLFVLSLVGSAVSMYFLARNIWKDDLSAVVASILYIYAPYRSVDVWVRGALPEAFSFILFPLILLSIERRSVNWLSLLVAVLIITHNLSFIMFLPVIIVWLIYKKFWKGLWALPIAGILSAFYILPIAFESKFIDLQSTVKGYFDFHNHFVTSRELFVSNFWGYGASQWGPKDDLSLAIGYLQWILPVIALILLFLKKKIFQYPKFLISFALGCFFIFLTHNKSTFVWEHLAFLSYIQFPWRFLGMIVFCFSLSAGILPKLIERQKVWVAVIVAGLAIVLNASFFRPDIWYKVDDVYYLTGDEWIRQRTASIGDFWPNFGHKIPDEPADGTYINYFPGWVSQVPPKDGLIPSAGSNFTDTPVRRIGNIISFISLICFLALGMFNKIWVKKT